MKVMIIDDKWIAEMISQMYYLVQKKNYHFLVCKKNFKDNSTPYDTYKENYTFYLKSPNENLDNFFKYREYDKNQEFEDDNPGANLLSFIRVFTLNEKNDSFTFSKEYCDFSTVFHYLNEFSRKQCFSSLCRFLYIILE